MEYKLYHRARPTALLPSFTNERLERCLPQQPDAGSSFNQLGYSNYPTYAPETNTDGDSSSLGQGGSRDAVTRAIMRVGQGGNSLLVVLNVPQSRVREGYTMEESSCCNQVLQREQQQEQHVVVANPPELVSQSSTFRKL